MTRAAAAPRPTDDARWRALVSGAGRTGRWIVAHDWTGSPLGPLRDWPQSLRTALVICLHSPTPAAIWWGPELVLLPNDGYLALPDPTGPQLPGRPGAAVWPDAVPALTGVLTAAEVTCRQEREFDSGGERRRWVFSSGPIVDATGRPGGVFTTVTATVTPADRATDVAEATDVDEPAAARRPDAAGTGTGTGIPAARRDLDPPVPHQHGGERRRALRQAEGLARLAGALSAAGSREAVTEVVTTVTPTLVGAAEVRVAVAAAGALDLTVTGGSGPGRLAVADDAPLARAVREETTVALPDGLCLPLRDGGGAVLGALQVRWAGPVADEEARRILLDAVAGLCSQALRRAELTASARAMAAFAARLSVTRSTGEAIEVILDAAPMALGAALPGLAMRDEGRRIRLWHGGLPTGLIATFDDLTIDDPRPFARALRTGERIILRNRAEFAARHPGLPDPAGAYGMVTTVVLPLLDASRRPIAALGFGWSRERPLHDDDLALLDTIADLCEQTLERVRLAAAEHNLVTRLAGRLRTSAAIGPPGLEVATRYQPAMSGLHLGGDWYDLVDLDDGRLAVVVGDVVGHQVEAAADMAQLRTVVNTLIRSGVPLAEVFPRLTGLLGVGFLGTCLAMVVDPVAGEAQVARVGHPHPVLLPSGRPPETVWTGHSLPLGLVRDPVPVTTVAFGPGDLLVAYTDGLVERRDQAYDAGVTALHEVLVPVRDQPVEAIADTLLAKLSGSDDDQALVVIRHVG
ncbi:Serine phosphatase RsbU, regulator of sigma subunit [Micromonospora matsumotoense]|uniref:Serine phosphatase RsbU, regulator of sigma subunit n=1 Tax=Micromonospora matsumotoense TaxID=121616 RepID=A0A1C4U4Q2_9ACTN|nr:GAF domain-containing SpoIIE family protein phosphatase [Micromonospora matsumotoense]SCE66652.1 Serine phosphatase RsbU, regulator of sigma subunit [Micromonospora matsumotoense]